MNVKNKLVNVDLKFVIEQLDDEYFVCNNLLDRKISIHKKEVRCIYTDKQDYIYIYTTIFNDSGFVFDYTTEIIKYTNSPILTTLEKIQHDLTSCFLNYSDESYIRDMLDYGMEIKYKSFEFGCKRIGHLYNFSINGHIGLKKGTAIVERSYIYDNMYNDLYESTYDQPKKLKDIFDLKEFTTSYFKFYNSLSTDGVIINICHLKYDEKKDILIKYFDNTLSVFKDKGNDIKVFTAESTIDELKACITKVIAEHPTDSMRRNFKKFNINQEQLTIEDLQIIMMVEI
jgi:hypothetical protein